MVQFGDLNGDGYLDVVTYAGTMGRTYMGNGQGNWASDATFSFSTPGHYSAMRVSGDFDHDGREDIVVQAAEGSVWTYTNIARAYSPWQEPSAISTRLIRPSGGETFMAGSARFVSLLTAVPPACGQASIDLHFSSTGPDGPWTPVATGLPDNCRFQWIVPRVNSSTCRMRITATAGGHTHQYVSPGDFSVVQGVSVGEGASAPVSRAELTVFPNPSAGTPLVIVGQGLAGELRVYDIAGRQIIGITVSGGAVYPLVTEGGNTIPAGVYVAVLNTPSQTLSTVFVKLGD